MPNLSFLLDDAIRTIRGEPNLDVARLALNSACWSQVIALAPNTHRIVRAVAALCGELPDLLDAQIVADPAFSDAVVRLIGTDAGDHVLASLANIAPTGWGRVHAAALIDTSQKRKRISGAAAALIGPCNESASLLDNTSNARFAIRRWGTSTPETPTAWMHALSAGERDRLIDMVRRDPHAAARCLPWLSPDTGNQMAFDDVSLLLALSAFAEASSTARSHHAEIVKRLVELAHVEHLSALTRLACAMKSEEAWNRVLTLIQRSPDAAILVVVEKPWNTFPKEVCDVIVDLLPAVSAARGQRDVMTLHVSAQTATAFFAALNPNIWSNLNVDVQRQWQRALPDHAAHLAVQSLGLRPEFLAQAKIANDVVRAVQCHTRDDATLHWTLFPVALRNLLPDESHALITAMPTSPPDPGAFFCIASGRVDSAVLDPARATLCTNADLARAVVLQRCTDDRMSTRDRCAVLHDALQGTSWNALKPIMALLSANVRTVIMPGTAEIVRRLARRNRGSALRQALDRLMSLPPDIALPTQAALNMITYPHKADKAATEIASLLRSHGDLFLSIGDALAKNLSDALLPLPTDGALANALRAMACDDPLTAQILLDALGKQDCHTAFRIMLTAPPHHTDSIWKALKSDARHMILSAVAATSLKSDPHIIHDSVAALTLAAIGSDNDALKEIGCSALDMHAAFFRTIWTRLPQEMQQILHEHPSFADLPIPSHVSTARSSRIR